MLSSTLRKNRAFALGTLVLVLLLGIVLTVLTISQSVSAQPKPITDPGEASGDGVTPQLIQNNPTCSDLGNYRNVKEDSPVEEGPYLSSDGYLTASIDDIYDIIDDNGTPDPSDDTVLGPGLDWSSTRDVDKVIVKGGDAADAYVYTPEDEADTQLHAPVNPNNGTYFGLSHVDFCYDVESDVTKTADTSFTREYKWTIDKSVTPETFNDLSMGGTGTANYTVSVNKNGFADKDWAVSGKITVTNPLNNESISIKEIKDVVSPSNTAASVTGCTSGGNDIPLPSASQPYTLAPNASLECSYSATLGGATNGKNTATAVSNTTGIGDGVGTADVTFGAPTTEQDKSVTVSDSYSGGPQNKSVSLSDVSTAAKTFPYSRTIGPYETCGQKDAVENTATLYGDNSAVLGSDSASVAVRVLCKAVVDKTLSGAAVSGSESFVFQLREGASLTKEGTVLEQVNANAQNGGDFTFTKGLVPGSTYQLCEQVMAGWMTTLGPPLYAIYNPSGDNSTVCTDFKAGETKTTTPGGTSTFTIDNQPPPGGLARTIGYWKNWSSCSGGKQKPVLDQTLAKSETGGIATGILTLHGNTATPDKATDCLKAVRLLSKQTIDGKKSMASDPAFNLASQYLAAKLNVVAGAGVNGTATTAINEAQTLLSAIKFNGSTHDKMTAAQITKANSLATTLDDYNNNRLNNLLTT